MHVDFEHCNCFLDNMVLSQLSTYRLHSAGCGKGEPGMEMHCDPRSGEVEAGGYWVWGQQKSNIWVVSGQVCRFYAYSHFLIRGVNLQTSFRVLRVWQEQQGHWIHLTGALQCLWWMKMLRLREQTLRKSCCAKSCNLHLETSETKFYGFPYLCCPPKYR